MPFAAIGAGSPSMFDEVWDKVAGAFGKGLGKYKFIRLLNTGSMARVWVGIDSYSRPFAIKVALKTVSKLIERLTVRYREGKSEGEITCEFGHPNIVRGIEFGKSRRGEYLVMELIEGDLMKVIPREDWGLFSDLLILHGRAVCNARKPACVGCDFRRICPTGVKYPG